MPVKIPPPPPLTQDPVLNRWLLELTAIFANSGGIDPNSIDGYPALQAQVAINTTNITALQTTTGGQAGSIALLQLQVIALVSGLAAANAQITTLGARSQVFNGTAAPLVGLGADGDWFGDRTNKHIYIKAAGAWVLIV